MTDADRVVGLTPGDPEPVVRDLQAVIDAATAAALPTIVEPGQVAAFVVPPGGGLAYLSRDTDEDRRREGLGPAISQAGTTVVRDESAIVTLAERWGHPQSVLVYADAVSRKVTAVLDDDPGGGQYGWRDRRVQLDLVHTPEWVRWAAIDGKLLSQVDFAEHVEACLEDIRSPSAADMLEIAQTLEATVDVTFRSGVRLRDGQRQFTYQEDASAAAGRAGELSVPEEIELALVPWQGRDARPFVVRARLRYRVSAQGLRLGVVLLDVERILTAAFAEDVLGPLRNAGLTVVSGRP